MKCSLLVMAALAFAPMMFSQGKSKSSKNVPAPQGSQAQKWDARPLVDTGRSDCGVESDRAAPKGLCPVSVVTTSFGLLMPDGKVAKFDEGGNSKAMDALKKSKKGSKAVTEFWKTGKTSTQVRADIAGTLTGDTLNVESVRIP